LGEVEAFDCSGNSLDIAELNPTASFNSSGPESSILVDKEF